MKENTNNLQGQSGAEVAGFPPLIGLVLATAAVLLQWRWPEELISDQGLATVIGAAVLALGIGLQVACVRSLKQARTTPLFKKATSTIVKTGPYARSRNPIYVAVMLQFTGLMFLFNSAWFLLIILILSVYLHFLVIRPEEEYLQKLFGKEYLDYKANVPRWL